MITNRAAKAVASLAMVLGLVVTMATPVSADDVTGTLTFGSNVIPIGGEPDPESPCEPYVDISFADNVNGTVDFTAEIHTTFQLPGSSVWHEAWISVVAENVVWSVNPSPPPDFNLGGTITWDIELSIVDDDCDALVLCVVRTRTVLIPPAGIDGSTVSIYAESNVVGGINPFVLAGSCGVTLSSQIVGQPFVVDLMIS